MVLALLSAVAAAASPAHAQGVRQRTFAAGAHVAVVGSDALGDTDLGFGGRLTWYPIPAIGLEADVTLYPFELPETRAISRRREEALFGVTVGPTVGRFRPFLRLRPGFVRVEAAPGPIACILIFPPPLACVLASGQTLAAVDLGGGLEAAVTGRTFVRVDVGDRVLKYPGSSLDRGRARDSGFAAHEWRVSLGAGWRF
jgi:hypothetical protein